MENLKIPFKLGMEYENWEFELDIYPSRLEYYDSYKYVGTELNKFLNKYTDETELLFNLDVLEGVIITFKDENLQFCKLINIINASSSWKLKNLFCVKEFTNFAVHILCIYKSRNVYIIYAKEELIKKLLKSIKEKKVYK